MSKFVFIGAGYEGKRLYQSLLAAVTAEEKESTEVSFLSKEETKALESAPPEDIERYFSDVDMVVNATNDDQHLSVLKILQHTKCFILSEKPLAAPGERIPERLNEKWSTDNIFALNCIERYSAAATEVKQKINESGLTVNRIDFTWAKNRFDDPRPTVGVVSEIIHPLDLCCYLSGSDTTDLQLLDASIVGSNYGSPSKVLPETAQVTFCLADTIVTGSASFGYSSRMRRVNIIASSTDGEREYFELTFDDPRWDYDHLSHWSSSGSKPFKTTVYEPALGNYPEGCDKLVRFWKELLTNERNPRFTTWREALDLHQFLTEISRYQKGAVLYPSGPQRFQLDRSNSERLG